MPVDVKPAEHIYSIYQPYNVADTVADTVEHSAMCIIL